MKAYTPRIRIGGTILQYAIAGVLNRVSLGRMLRVLRRDEGRVAARQCRDWLVWLGSYPLR